MTDTITWTRDDGEEDFRARILPLLREGLEVAVKRGACVSTGPLEKGWGTGSSKKDWLITDGPYVASSTGMTPDYLDSITFTRPEPEWASARIIAVGDQGYLRYRQSDGRFSHGLGVPETYWWSVRDLVENYGVITVVVDAEGKLNKELP